MSSIGIYLHSSTRILVARVHWVDADARVEIMFHRRGPAAGRR
jgi:hypothetical protein